MELNGYTARPSRYFAPRDNKGKYHAAWAVGFAARCGAGVLIDPNAEIAIEGGVEMTKVHPIVCRRCLRFAASWNKSSEGLVG
jgi:hypothetical protein